MKKSIFIILISACLTNAWGQQPLKLFIPDGKGFSFAADQDNIQVDRTGKFSLFTNVFQTAWLIHKNKVVKTFTTGQYRIYEYQKFGFAYLPNQYYELVVPDDVTNTTDTLHIKDFITNALVQTHTIPRPKGKGLLKQLVFINARQIGIVYQTEDSAQHVTHVYTYDLLKKKAKMLFNKPSGLVKTVVAQDESVLNATFSYTKVEQEWGVGIKAKRNDSTFFVDVYTGKMIAKLANSAPYHTRKGKTITLWEKGKLFVSHTAKKQQVQIGSVSEGTFFNYTFYSQQKHITATFKANKECWLYTYDELGKLADSINISSIGYLYNAVFKNNDFVFYNHKVAVHEPTLTVLFTNGQDLYSVDLRNHRVEYSFMGSTERLRDRLSAQKFIQQYRPNGFNGYKLNLALTEVYTTAHGKIDQKAITKSIGDKNVYSNFIIFQNRVRPMVIDFYERYFPIRYSIKKDSFNYALVDVKKGDVVNLPTYHNLPFETARFMKCFDSLSAVFEDFRGDYTKHYDIRFINNTSGMAVAVPTMNLMDIEQADQPDLFYVLVNNHIRLFDLNKQQYSNALITFDTTTFKPHLLRYHKTANLLFVSSLSRNGITRIYNTQSHTFINESKLISYASQQLIGDYWINYDRSGTSMNVISLSNDSVLFQVHPINDSDWVITHSSGLFDASAGAMRQLYFVAGTEPIALDQLKDRFYEPGLAGKLMGLNKEPIRPVKGLLDVKLYPDAELALVDSSGETYVYIQLTNKGGGLGKTSLIINGKEAIEDVRPADFNIHAPKALLIVPVSNLSYFVCGAPNTIEVKTWNSENYIQSKGAIIRYQCKSNKDSLQPRLFVLSVGVSDYQGKDIDLRFASKDALAISKALELGGKNLFGTHGVRIYNLNTEKGFTAPTREQLIKTFQLFVDSCTSADVVVMYFSGHGVNYGGSEGDFYFLTQQAASANASTYQDAVLRNAVALSSKEITDWAKKIPALKQVLILDACGSGKAVDNLMAGKDIESSTIRALDRLKDRTGMHIIAGCAANAVSYEASLFGQGLLTYSLLEGVKGAALRESQFQDVALWFQYARDRVSVLAKENGLEQEPRVFSPYGNESFDIGIMTPTDKANVPLSMPKPMFVKSNFIEDTQLDDVLNLSHSLNEQLRLISSKGYEAHLAYIDVNEFSNGYKITGRYKIQKNGTIILNMRLKGAKHDQRITIKAINDQELVRIITDFIAALFK